MSEPTSTHKVVEIPEVIGVSEYAQKLGLPATKIIGELMKNGVLATINEQIDFDTAAIIGADLGFELVPEKAQEVPLVTTKPQLASGEGEPRPPIVAVMGHVDHGKTSLLDAIRQTDVVSGEAGGITQHIGAYQIKRNDRWITFLDTPGHEAFSAIRAHGARMTDVAIIVVAADDGVKPQTKEAIRHAQEANVKIVIAINKVDKEGADVNRVKQELAEMNLIPEDWGGNTVMLEVSAKQKKNIDQLLDLVLLVADLEDLRARYDGLADGVIIESHMETGRGPVATVLVQSGYVHPGDYITAGETYAKVRSLEDWHGKRIKQAAPGMPAVVTGFKAVPAFGDMFQQVASEREAKELALSRRRQESIKSLVKIKKIGAEELARAITAGKVSELGVIVKADVQGSLESLQDSLNTLRNEEVAVRVVSAGIGDISENDVTLAKTTGALLIGFNVGASPLVRQLAVREGVQLHLYKVIYELLDDIRSYLSSMLKPEIIETVIGRLKVLGVFKTTKAAVVCGGEVKAGKVEPKLLVRVRRGSEVVGEGVLQNLQKDKAESRQVVEGEQCGLNITPGIGVQVGDEIEFFSREEKARTL